MIAGTAMAWHEALTLGTQWDQQLDAPRFRHAFVALAARRRTWPAPADFVEHLPPREQLALTKQYIRPNPERVKSMLDKLARELRA